MSIEKAVVKGTSMHPLLHCGDLVELELVGRKTLSCGDVIAFTDVRGVRVIHRVISVDPLQTQGDNRCSPDKPVPENSNVFLASAMVDRKNERRIIAGGTAGMKIFRRHQLRFRILEFARRCVMLIASLNPVKKPFCRLKKSVFAGSMVYYSGSRPVGWIDDRGWHWKGRFDCIFIQRPPSALIREVMAKLGKEKEF